MKLIKLTLLASVTVILAGCDTVQTTQAPPVDHTRLMAVNDNLIVPGQRIGPVFLGMTEAELYSKLGNLTANSAIPPILLTVMTDLDMVPV